MLVGISRVLMTLTAFNTRWRSSFVSRGKNASHCFFMQNNNVDLKNKKLCCVYLNVIVKSRIYRYFLKNHKYKRKGLFNNFIHLHVFLQIFDVNYRTFWKKKASIQQHLHDDRNDPDLSLLDLVDFSHSIMASMFASMMLGREIL